MRNIIFYGETEARDCRQENVCQNGFDSGCVQKNAIMPSCFADHSKPPLVEATPAWPQYKIKGDGSLGGRTVYENMSFINFKSSKTYCGSEQRLFRLNRFAADYTPKVQLTKPKFHNVDYDAFAFLFTPPNAWSVVDDCGEFPCTGPLNVLLMFEDATFTGS